MRSAITIAPGRFPASEVGSFTDLLAWSHHLSILTGRTLEILVQHNLREDKMAVMVGGLEKTLSGVDEDFVTALDKATREVREYHEELRSAQEPAAGKARRRGAGRKGPARVGVQGLRQG